MRFITTYVRERAAIVLGEDKSYLVVTRLQKLCERHGFGHVAKLIAALRITGNVELGEEVIDALTTNETYFFRDIHPFEALQHHVLPEVIRMREQHKSLNLWCAASSSGQEPYSVALLIREFFPFLQQWDFNFYASDISAEMLRRSASGVYSRLEVGRGLPAEMLSRYFDADGPSSYVIKPEIRRMVKFMPLNLSKPFPSLPRLDIVFMRNVLIYFEKATKQEIFARVRGVLRPGGYLFLGASETTVGFDDNFTPVRFGETVCYRNSSNVDLGA